MEQCWKQVQRWCDCDCMMFYPCCQPRLMKVKSHFHRWKFLCSRLMAIFRKVHVHHHLPHQSLTQLGTWICISALCFSTQGTESSDCLISDFFPTPRAILEISVNLKKIFLGGGGMVVGVKWPKKHWNAPPVALKSLGRAPRPPCKKPYSSQFIYHSVCISHQARRYALFRLFCQNPFWPLQLENQSFIPI